MDRFKFRVSLKLETKSILLYSNNVNFDNREMILSGKDFKKQIESYNLIPKDYKFLYAYVYEEDVDYNPNYFVEFDNIEQSTGLKDKNDKLIYEHDYVMINKIIYEVFWNKTKISLANILNGDIIDFIETEEMEIIGNEHEETNIRKI